MLTFQAALAALQNWHTDGYVYQYEKGHYNCCSADSPNGQNLKDTGCFISKAPLIKIHRAWWVKQGGTPKLSYPYIEEELQQIAAEVPEEDWAQMDQ